MKKVFCPLTLSNLNHQHVRKEFANIPSLLNILPGFQNNFYQAAIVVSLKMAQWFLMDIL